MTRIIDALLQCLLSQRQLRVYFFTINKLFVCNIAYFRGKCVALRLITVIGKTWKSRTSVEDGIYIYTYNGTGSAQVYTNYDENLNVMPRE